jgi:hypothetical protein
MTTCLDTNACPNIMYNVVCNFSIGIDNEYACDPKTTCMRADGKYDCCGDHIVRCIVDAASLRVPTIQPSIAISETNCDKMCSTGSKIDKCYWYEILRTDKLCVENNNEYCCAKNIADCCSTNKTSAYIVFGCIAGIVTIIAIAYYRYYVNNSHKIATAKDAPKVELPDRYKMIIRV